MKKLTCLIVDDEPLALDLIESYVRRTPFLELAGRCASAFEAMEKIDNQAVDLIFLDIQMPDLSGLEFSRTLREGPRVIFTTAFEAYALEGFKVDALDYLLKPFNAERVEQTMAKIRDRDSQGEREATSANARKAVEELSATGLQRIPVPTADRYKLVDFDEVVAIEVEERMTNIFTLSKSYPINLTLENFERKLPGEQFLRISRSCIINLHAIQEIVLWFGNRYKIILSNGKEVISSRERSKMLKKMLKF